MSKNIYVVFGQTGEYSDATEWAVVAFDEEEKARKQVEFLEQHLSYLGILASEGHLGVNSREEGEKVMKQFDPDCLVDYTGTRYYYVELPLIEGACTIPVSLERGIDG